MRRYGKRLSDKAIAAALICLVTSAAAAGDQGDPAQSCDGSTPEIARSAKAP